MAWIWNGICLSRDFCPINRIDQYIINGQAFGTQTSFVSEWSLADKDSDSSQEAQREAFNETVLTVFRRWSKDLIQPPAKNSRSLTNLWCRIILYVCLSTSVIVKPKPLDLIWKLPAASGEICLMCHYWCASSLGKYSGTVQTPVELAYVISCASLACTIWEYNYND